jgi:hypothetical protein
LERLWTCASCRCWKNKAMILRVQQFFCFRHLKRTPYWK